MTAILPQIATGRIQERLLFQKPDPAENICNRLTGELISELFNGSALIGFASQILKVDLFETFLWAEPHSDYT